MNTAGYVMQAMLNPDGHIFVPIPGTSTRLGSGLLAVVQAALTAATYEINLDKLLFRYGMQDDSQMQYGRPNGTSGANANPLLPGTVDQTPYSRTQRPPVPSTQVFGTNDLGTARTIAKGIQVNTINLVYQVLGANLTSATIGMTKTVFASGVAPVVIALLANANNGILLPVAAQPIITSIAVPNPVPLTTRFTQNIIELDITTPAGSIVNLYGIYLDCSFNFN